MSVEWRGSKTTTMMQLHRWQTEGGKRVKASTGYNITGRPFLPHERIWPDEVLLVEGTSEEWESILVLIPPYVIIIRHGWRRNQVQTTGSGIQLRTSPIKVAGLPLPRQRQPPLSHDILRFTHWVYVGKIPPTRGHFHQASVPPSLLLKRTLTVQPLHIIVTLVLVTVSRLARIPPAQLACLAAGDRSVSDQLKAGERGAVVGDALERESPTRCTVQRDESKGLHSVLLVLVRGVTPVETSS
ncbi:hypothetical protein BXZ70DRAFT_1077020 [Cristinia sonorae]|uniref:Uncharacterized protein n=1 Tax=Cristinia sonorae TaxID=1940300 RepID=A0A8K0UT24_9AGAR|nr:hypothetical protein BXZ70DRAFT_1077020 [Cristinia sonorae]